MCTIIGHCVGRDHFANSSWNGEDNKISVRLLRLKVFTLEI
jgi:hypothetical protein